MNTIIIFYLCVLVVIIFLIFVWLKKRRNLIKKIKNYEEDIFVDGEYLILKIFYGVQEKKYSWDIHLNSLLVSASWRKEFHCLPPFLFSDSRIPRISFSFLNKLFILGIGGSELNSNCKILHYTSLPFSIKEGDKIYIVKNKVAYRI